jgi:hypothetical protein
MASFTEREIGRQIQAEDGVGEAARLIERYADWFNA